MNQNFSLGLAKFLTWSARSICWTRLTVCGRWWKCLFATVLWAIHTIDGIWALHHPWVLGSASVGCSKRNSIFWLYVQDIFPEHREAASSIFIVYKW